MTDQLTPHEARLLHALLVSVTFSGGVGLALYGLAEAAYTKEWHAGWFLQSACIVGFALFLWALKPPRA